MTYIMTYILWILLIINILASLFAAAYCVHKTVVDKKGLSETVTIVGGAVGALSLLWAAFTYYDSAHRQKEIWAMSIYQEHTKLTIDHDNLKFITNGEFAKKDPPPPLPDDPEYERYEWYVGNALFSFESILDVTSGGDDGWNRTFIGFIKDHKKYIESKRFDCKRYNMRLQQLITETTTRNCFNEPDTQGSGDR